MRPGTCYVWRVWPYTGTRFTPKPLGFSNYYVAKASVLKKEGRAGGRRRKAARRGGGRGAPARGLRALPFTRLRRRADDDLLARGAPYLEALATGLIADCTAPLEDDGVRVSHLRRQRLPAAA